MELSIPEFEGCETGLFESNSRPGRPVDLVHLARQTLGDRALECEILQLFRRQSISSLVKLNEADSHEAWCAAAHSLKGSAGAIGAWPVAALAEKAEVLSAADFDTHRTEVLGELDRAIQSTNAYILSLFDCANES